ncbi:MAG: protein translocase subunit SecF [Pseudomonadota bacterium]
MLRLVPANTSINFVKLRYIMFLLSTFIVLGSLAGFMMNGLNYGIDFRGGFLIEIRTPEIADLSGLRTKLSGLDLGDVKLQGFGSDTRDVMIRIERQPGGEKAQSIALNKIRQALGKDVTYRRVETVGPKVSEDLKRKGLMAIGFALLAMLVYIWFRFEWQFGFCAIVALTHDCTSIIGLYAFLPCLEFNETAIIAILTTAGYSINDTVVIYDRIRENLRKYKKESMPEIINRSINNTLSRTVLTSVTTLLALFALYFFGGNVIATFSLPIIVGITVGTYSSLCLSSLLLLYFKLGGEDRKQGAA